MKPTPFQAFCGYYLGLDSEFRYRFFNLGSLASHYGIGPGDLRAIMDEARISPETTRHVDYNIARAHATAQELAEVGGEDVRAFARRTFEEFMQALGGYDPTRDFENVDYDRILPGDEPPAGTRD
jgi:hypothetical protein